MLHEAGQRHAVLLRQLRHGAAAVAVLQGQLRQDLAARSDRQRGEHKVELGVLGVSMVNHMVKYWQRRQLCQGLRSPMRRDARDPAAFQSELPVVTRRGICRKN